MAGISGHYGRKSNGNGNTSLTLRGWRLWARKGGKHGWHVSASRSLPRRFGISSSIDLSRHTHGWRSRRLTAAAIRVGRVNRRQLAVTSTPFAPPPLTQWKRRFAPPVFPGGWPVQGPRYQDLLLNRHPSSSPWPPGA